MAKTQLNKRQNRTSPKRVLGAALALLVAFLLLSSVIGLAEKYIAIRGRVHDLKEKQSELSTKREQLAATNRYIETPEGRERELRGKYNVVRPGEEMIVITEPKAIESAETSSRVGKWWDSLLRGLGLRKN